MHDIGQDRQPDKTKKERCLMIQIIAETRIKENLGARS